MYVWQIQGIPDSLVLACKDIGNQGSVCIFSADLGKLDKAVHLSGRGTALCLLALPP